MGYLYRATSAVTYTHGMATKERVDLPRGLQMLANNDMQGRCPISVSNDERSCPSAAAMEKYSNHAEAQLRTDLERCQPQQVQEIAAGPGTHLLS